jgi:hypothetical protein
VNRPEAQVQTERFRKHLATLRQEAADLMAGRAELAERLAAESERTEQQRHRAETAEQHASRASGPNSNDAPANEPTPTTSDHQQPTQRHKRSHCVTAIITLVSHPASLPNSPLWDQGAASGGVRSG